jgi:sugar/nucleoside kinase (ribokinase family)
MMKMVRVADILRLNIREAKFITGTRTTGAAVARLLAQGPRLVAVTDGSKGCSYATKSSAGRVPGFAVKAVDTTGCGDGFLAGLLTGIIRLRTDIDRLRAIELDAVCRYANAVGALVATRPGGIPAMPSNRMVLEFLRKHP